MLIIDEVILRNFSKYSNSPRVSRGTTSAGSTSRTTSVPDETTVPAFVHVSYLMKLDFNTVDPSPFMLHADS